MWRKGNPFALLVGMWTGKATVESNMEIPQKKINMDLLFDLAFSFLGLYMKRPKTLIQKNINNPMFIVA